MKNKAWIIAFAILLIVTSMLAFEVRNMKEDLKTISKQQHDSQMKDQIDDSISILEDQWEEKLDLVKAQLDKVIGVAEDMVMYDLLFEQLNYYDLNDMYYNVRALNESVEILERIADKSEKSQIIEGTIMDADFDDALIIHIQTKAGDQLSLEIPTFVRFYSMNEYNWGRLNQAQFVDKVKLDLAQKLYDSYTFIVVDDILRYVYHGSKTY